MRAQSRPDPLNLIPWTDADRVLHDGDIGLFVGEGRLPARIIQRITGSPYVHTLGIRRVNGVWLATESKPPRVRCGPLEPIIQDESGLYDFYRLKSEAVNLSRAWYWAVAAVGTRYGYDDLWRVWRVRYANARRNKQCDRIPLLDFFEDLTVSPPPGASSFVTPTSGNISLPWVMPEPNSDDPRGARRDCSALWGASFRVNNLDPPLQEFDCLVIPGDFPDPDVSTYVGTLTYPFL